MSRPTAKYYAPGMRGTMRILSMRLSISSTPVPAIAKITCGPSATPRTVCSEAQMAFASTRMALMTSMSYIYLPGASVCCSATVGAFYKVPVTSTGKRNLVACVPVKFFPN